MSAHRLARPAMSAERARVPRRAWVAGALALAVALAALAAAPPATRAAGMPTAVVSTLPNGLTVGVLPTHRAPIVQIALLVPAPGADDAGDGPGVAALTAAALRLGTTSRDGITYTLDVEALGGAVSASAGRDFTILSGSFLARDLEAGLELVADAAINPTFQPGAVEAARQQCRGVALRSETSPPDAADDALWALALRGTPLAPPPEGTTESLALLPRAAAQQFHHAHYRPDRCVLVIAGDVDPAQAQAAASEWFGAWSGHAAPAPPPGPVPAGIAIRIVDRPDLARAEIRVGTSVAPRSSADALALALANTALGGMPDARLARTVGAADPRSTLTALRDGGVLALSASTAPDSAAAVAAALADEVRGLASRPLAESELAPARTYLRRLFPLPMESLASLTGQWLAARFYGLPEDFFARYDQRVAALSAADVAGAIQRWIHPDRLAIVVVGPAARVRAGLERLGTVEVVLPALQAGRVFVAPTPEAEKRGRGLIAQATEAHGGSAAMLAIRTSIVDANVTLASGMRDMQGGMRVIRAEPGRMVLTSSIEGGDSRQFLSGDRAWLLAGPDTSSAEPADSLVFAGLKAGFESDVPHELLWAGRPDRSVAWRGRETLDGRTVEVVEVMAPGGARRQYLIDAETHVLRALEEPGRTGVGFGARRIYRDCRKVGGVLWPYSEERWLDGQRVMAINVSKVAINPVVDPVIFRPPASLDAKK